MREIVFGICPIDMLCISVECVNYWKYPKYITQNLSKNESCDEKYLDQF